VNSLVWYKYNNALESKVPPTLKSKAVSRGSQKHTLSKNRGGALESKAVALYFLKLFLKNPPLIPSPNTNTNTRPLHSWTPISWTPQSTRCSQAQQGKRLKTKSSQGRARRKTAQSKSNSQEIASREKRGGLIIGNNLVALPFPRGEPPQPIGRVSR
jgi:hypothetical protein